MVDVRHARFNAGLITSTFFNANRSADAEALEVWDFIPGFERNADEVEQDKLRRSVYQSVEHAFTRMHGRTVEQVRAEAVAMIKRMEGHGTQDAEGIVREAFESVIQQPYGG
jgi:hypothetical protein